ncbi:MAG: tetratricopeptide repeat protein [Pseudomonadota bacterium]
MRFTPAALALSLVLALSASMSHSAPPQVLDPRADALMAKGRAALAAGSTDQAIDLFESALAIQPGSVAITLNLAEATRRQGLQGKALHYYREALERDPQNLAAIAGEGAALSEKGALEKAKRNLARLQGLCGSTCAETRALSATIARGPAERVITADAAKPATISVN